MNNVVEIPLSDKRIRVAERMQILQDVASTAALVPAGLLRMHSTDPSLRALACAELAAVVVLVVMTIRELRDRDDDVTGVSWANLIIGALLVAESLIQTSEGAKLIRPALVTGVTSIFLGLAQNRLRKKRAGVRMLRISDDRLSLRLSPFRKFDHPWSDIEAIHDSGDVITITVHGGKTRRIRMRRYDNSDAIRDALARGAERAAVKLLRG